MALKRTLSHLVAQHQRKLKGNLLLTMDMLNFKMATQVSLEYILKTGNMCTVHYNISSDQDESSGSNLDPWTVQTSANETTPSYLADENMETETTPLIGNDDETTPLVNGLSPVADNKEEEEQQVVVMEWYSCGICLEEMVDSDLLTHVSCGALLCADCLESSKQHSMKDNGQMPCPVRHFFNYIHTYMYIMYIFMYTLVVYYLFHN